MKNIVLFLALVFSFSKANTMPSYCSNYSNIKSKSTLLRIPSHEELSNPCKMKPPLAPIKPPKRIPFFMVVIRGYSPTEIIKYPTENIVSVNNWVFQYVNQKAGTMFNGMMIRNDLVLTATMDNNLFLGNIVRAFGTTAVQYASGHMSRKFFINTYPNFLQQK